MAVNINVPSQVKTYANLAAFPATGALKTIYIAEDTNKTYRWTGSVYTEISASAAMTWGAIGGTLSNQTDLQSALDAKVPTSRTLTINGVTQDLSANRTFTISTGITIGSTAITSGTVGRILFEGAGNVVQESVNLFWDNTNGLLGIGTSSPSFGLDVNGTARVQGLTTIRTLASSFNSPLLVENTGSVAVDNKNVATFIGARGNASNIDDNTNIGIQQKSNIVNNYATLNFFNAGFNLAAYIGAQFLSHGTGQNGNLLFGTTSSGTPATRMTIFSTGNVGIGTTTDAGFRLDVNGTARVQGNAQFGTGFYWDNTNNRLGIGTSTPTSYTGWNSIDIRGTNGGQVIVSNTALTRIGEIFVDGNGMNLSARTALALLFKTSDIERMRFTSGGNVLINTTTDAGFRLDVNGTARVMPQGTTTAAVYFQTHGFYVNRTRFGIGASDGVNSNQLFQINVNTSSGKSYLDGWNDGGSAQYDIVIGNSGSRTQFGTDSTSVASAQVTINSTTRGFLPPRMTTTQKNAIASPAAGLMVYDTTLNVISYYNGTMWI